MDEAMSRLDPHLGVFDLKSPRKISNNIKIPAPVLTTIGAWLHQGR